MRGWIGRLRWLLPAIAAAAALAFLPLPLYAIGPGSAVEVVPLIRVSGHPEHRPGGRLILTTISFRRLTAVGALVAWLDPAWSVVPREELFAPGETEREEERRSRSEMDQSKVDAAAVVLSRLAGYPEEHRPGALVERVTPGCPAARELAPGDVVVEVDGVRIAERRDASRAIRAAAPGEPIRLAARSGGELRRFTLARQRCVPGEPPVIGVVLIENLPFAVRMASGPIGGPSAGLAWALGLYDLLTPGELGGGRVVAATGTIDLEGNVGGVGGIAEKARAAARAGADLFLVPRADLAEARTAGVEGVRLVPVSTFDEAVAALTGGA
ncbi:MAG TPA: S16 family serine protease [Actinomycetota bacterium]|nr:S16 family serine protease [Actinomycetota bacterium]